MKVKELIEILKDIDPEHEVILSKDGEGNSFSPLADHSPEEYEPTTTWSGELVWGTEEDGEKDNRKINSVVLWPTN